MAPRTKQTPPTTGDELTRSMAAFGIERIPVDYFHWNGFRYSTLKDAVTAARRAKSMASVAGA